MKKKSSSSILQFGKVIKEARKHKGLTQAQLARESLCSLASLQNIEAGKANPELETLERILNSVGLKLTTSNYELNTNYWGSLGIPLFNTREISIIPTKELLLEQLNLLDSNLNSITDERTNLALTSFLTAIQTHFPNTYSLLSPHIKSYLIKNQTLYLRPKLRRLSLEILGTYL